MIAVLLYFKLQISFNLSYLLVYCKRRPGAATVFSGECCAVSTPGLAFELRDHKGRGNQRDSSSNDIDLHFGLMVGWIQGRNARTRAPLVFLEVLYPVYSTRTALVNPAVVMISSNLTGGNVP